MDPAVIGTLMIGLESNRREDESPRPRNPRRPVRIRPHSARHALAQALRSVANRLEPAHGPTVGSGFDLSL